jgi:hypothetical protein
MAMITPRWYVVDKRGLATLCKDADDAKDVAADAFVQWPQHGPYCVALLGDVTAERERIAELVRSMPEMFASFADADDFARIVLSD